MSENEENPILAFQHRFTAICAGLWCAVAVLVFIENAGPAAGKTPETLFGLGLLATGLAFLGWWSARSFKQLLIRQQNTQYTQARLAAIVDSSKDAILSKDLNGFIQTWNAGAQQLYGYTAEEIVGQKISTLVPPHMKDEIPNILERLARGEMIGEYQTKRITKSGEIVPVSLCISPVRDPHGNIVAASTVARDMRAYQAALDKITESETHLRTLMSNVIGMVYRGTADADRTMSYVSRGSLELLAISSEDLMNNRKGSYGHLVHADDRGALQDEIADAIQNERPYRAEYRVNCGPDQWKWVREQGRCISTPKTEEHILEGLIVDVTDQKNFEEKIRTLNLRLETDVEERTRELETANAELEAFCYSVSHDLRSPLRGLHGFSQALLEDYPDRLDDRGVDYLNRIRTASMKMGELIDALLELSRMSRQEMHRKELNLTGMVKDRIRLLREMDPDRLMDIHVQEGMQAYGDPELIAVVLANLLDNAWKFTSKLDRPSIRCECNDTDEGHVFYIRDNGAGFDMAYADKLFTAFQRLHKTSEFPGTGVGLTTVQRIIHRHGGEIWVEAEQNAGCTFYFTLRNKGAKDE